MLTPNTTTPAVRQDFCPSTMSEHAIAIRDLGKRSIDNVIEIGRRLTEAKAIAGHGEFGPWLDREFAWTERTAQNFMRVYELSKTKCVSDLNLPLAGLYLLAAPSTPERARDEVIERAAAGTPVSVADIRSSITKLEQVATNETEEDETADEDMITDDGGERDDDGHLAERLRAAEIKIAGLESEVEELKAETARLRSQLGAKQETTTEKQDETAPPKSRRGRPPGSRNKPKPPATPAAIGVTEPMPEFLRRAS
jgi:hypothetical protein